MQDKANAAIEARREAAVAAQNLASLIYFRDAARAVDILRKGTELNPEDAGLWIDYSDALQKSGRSIDARAAVERALALSRAENDKAGIATALVRLAQLGKQSDDPATIFQRFREAAAYTQEVLKVEPERAECLSCLSVALEEIGWILLDQGKTTAAEDALAESYKISIQLYENNQKKRTLPVRSSQV